RDANFGNIYRWDGSALPLTATHNTPAAFADLRRRLPISGPSIRGTLTPTGYMVATKKTVHVADLAAEPIYTQHQEPGAVAAVELGGVRTLLGIRDRPISPGSPWQNGYAERLIGTVRRECLDRILIFGESHLRRVLASYAAFNQPPTHL